MTRVQPDPKVQERIHKLKSIPVERVRPMILDIVGLRIGDLSLKDSHRALYVHASVLNDVRNMTNRLSKTFESVDKKMKALIEECEKDSKKTFTNEELVQKLREIIAQSSPEELAKAETQNEKSV